MLIGQAHACDGSWLLPGGTVCVQCPEISSNTKSRQKPAIVGQDCRQCCKFVDCSDSKSKSDAAREGAPSLVLARIAPALDLPFPSPLSLRTIFACVRSFFSHAPP